MQYMRNTGKVSALGEERYKGRNIDAVIARGDRTLEKLVRGRV